MSITDAIIAAVRREAERRRGSIDGSTDLGEVVVRVRLQAGSGGVRAVVWEEERLYRSAMRAKDARDVLQT